MRDVRFEDKPNNIFGLGNSFVTSIAGDFMTAFPENELKFYNRGIAGIKTPELLERWDRSCLSLKPDVLTIMVGAVDYIQTVRRGYEGTIDLFEQSLDQILNQTKKALPESLIIIMEPYLLANNTLLTQEVVDGFRPYQIAVKNLSKQNKTLFIETQKTLEEAAELNSGDYWCPDGIHPSPAGIKLLADLWKEGFYGL